MQVLSVRVWAMALALLSTTTSAGLGEEAEPLTGSNVRGGEPLPDYELTQIPVAERPHRDFDPVGIEYESIFFYPSLTGAAVYNSNIFATPTDRKADLAAVISPRLLIDYDRQNSAFELQLGADIYRFRKFTDQDRINAFARANSDHQLTESLEFETTLEAARKHDVPGEASSQLNAAEPIPYTDLFAQASLTKTLNRLGVSIDGTARNLTYENVDSFSGELLDQTWRDGNIFTASVKPFYELAPGYRAFVQARANTRDYAGTGDLNRDSEGYDIGTGVEFGVTPLISGEVAVGYLSETYTNPEISPIDGLSFMGEATWLMTPLMTLIVSGERKVAETTTPDFLGRVDTVVGVELDYELLRNLIVSVGPEFARQDFPNTPRRDDVVRMGVGIDYLVNPIASVAMRYDFVDRDSTLAEYSFDQHVISLNVTAQY